MPKKLGNGGNGLEEYNSETGRYISDGQPNKYYNNPAENKILNAMGITAPSELKNVSENKILNAMGAGDVNVYYETVKENDVFDVIPKKNRKFVKFIADRVQFLKDWIAKYSKYVTVKKPSVEETFKINTPERISFRKKAVADELARQENASPKNYERKATIVLGLPASGKSFVTKKYLDANKAYEIDSDIFTHIIPEFQADNNNVSAVHKEAGNMSKDMLSKVMEKGGNFVIGKVGGGDPSDTIKMLDNLQANGYTVDIVYGDLPVEKSLERNLMRHLNGEPRLVPPSVAIGAEPKLFSNISTFLNHPAVTGGEIYNNDVPRGEKPKLLKKFIKRKGE